jgi:hypothetical protein
MGRLSKFCENNAAGADSGWCQPVDGRPESSQPTGRRPNANVFSPLAGYLELMYRFPAVLMERADVPDGMKALSLSSKP